MRSYLLRLAGPAVVLAAIGVLHPTLSARAQAAVGLYAAWGDLETWTHHLDESREDELGLGLHVTGQGGTMLVAFLGRLSTNSPDTPPTEISIQVGANERANSNTLRTPTLMFSADEGLPHPALLDFSARLHVDNIAPGSAPDNGIATVPTPDFVRLAAAATLRATVLGFTVDFRPDQIEAMRTFANQLHLDVP